MSYAKYVGRVGALAVALGFGAAVATSTPGIAFAEESEPDGNVGTNQGGNQSVDSKTDPDSTPPPVQQAESGGSNTSPQENQDDAVQPGGDLNVRQAEPGQVLSTGGHKPDENKFEESKPESPPSGAHTPTAPPPVVDRSPQAVSARAVPVCTIRCSSRCTCRGCGSGTGSYCPRCCCGAASR